MARDKRQQREFDIALKRSLEPPRLPKEQPFVPANRNRMRRGGLLVTYGAHCWYCGRNLTPKTVTREHVIPKAIGGKDMGNVKPACITCNQLKGALTVEQFREAARVAWESRKTHPPGDRWRFLFGRFGQVGVSFYCDGKT